MGLDMYLTKEYWLSGYKTNLEEITFHYTDVQDTRHYVVQEFDDNSMTYAALLQMECTARPDKAPILVCR